MVAWNRHARLAKVPRLRHTVHVSDPSQFDDTDMTRAEFRARLAQSVPTDLYVQFLSPSGNTGGGLSSDILHTPAIGQLVHWGEELVSAR